MGTMSVKENMWESSSEISSVLYKPLEQKVSGDCYDSFRLYNTKGHYNTHNKRKKKTKQQPTQNQDNKKQAEPEELVESPPSDDFYFILVTNSRSSILKPL